MIPSDIRDYLKIYRGFVDDDLCDKIKENLKTVDWTRHSFYDYKNDASIQNDKELSITYHDIEGKELIDRSIWFALEKYVLKDFSAFSDWWAGWNGYTNARFNKYDIDTEMRLHCDHINSMFDGSRKGIPTLSVVGLLNDDYEGGDFVMWEDQIIDLKKGDVMIFPSNFMYPHKVTEVTKGCRYSFVSWAW